jgi:hypothetical protein
MNNKFDLIYEECLHSLKEATNYISATFLDNIALLVKVLVKNDFLSSPLTTNDNEEATVLEYAEDILNQEKNTKEITLDVNDQLVPPIKLLLAQDGDSESFSVTVLDINDPKKQKEFKNTMLETIFEEVIAYIKQVTLQGLDTAKQAVNQMPPEEGANAQPGSTGESELPGTDSTEPSV